jgi:hypothetical protein
MRKLLLNLNLNLFLILICSCSDAEQATHTPAPTIMPDAKAVLVRTDRAEYQQGEVVKLWVKNNLDAPLWYAREAECGLSFWLARDCEKPLPEFEGACLWEMPQHDFRRLDPGQVLQDDEVGEREGEWYKLDLSEPGCYVIAFKYSLVEKQALGDGWGADGLEVLSDEFIIKP